MPVQRLMAPVHEHIPVNGMHRLMVSGWVRRAPVEVRRSMARLGSDGLEMGQVTAVVVEGAAQAATHLLLCRLLPEPEYRLAPISLIDRVDEASVQLRVPGREVTTLPRREAP